MYIYKELILSMTAASRARPFIFHSFILYNIFIFLVFSMSGDSYQLTKENFLNSPDLVGFFLSYKMHSNYVVL